MSLKEIEVIYKLIYQIKLLKKKLFIAYSKSFWYNLIYCLFSENKWYYSYWIAEFTETSYSTFLIVSFLLSTRIMYILNARYILVIFF